MNRTERSRIKRAPKRGYYDRETIFRILDAGQICHIGFIHHNKPVVIPTIYGRSNDKLYIHGAAISRLIAVLEKGIDISLSVAHVDGLVLARSAFHHSMNYRSVVVFGKAKPVADADKTDALKIISDHLISGRWDEVRKPNTKELKATKVLEIEIDEASAKIRTGGPVDDKEDYDSDIWAGEIPLKITALNPVDDKKLVAGIEVPDSVRNYYP
ncbi:MAG: pyridoxamine 5'-phosphate oxidase family protein [Cytophagales bacterium]|nr:pyridoxamine 5'-phosphate oxidase family protein [Cytophagales bacterium]